MFVCQSVSISQSMSPLDFLPFTQKIFGQPIPEHSWLFKTFCCEFPYEQKISNILFYSPSDHFVLYIDKTAHRLKG